MTTKSNPNSSFFDERYQEPNFISERKNQARHSRRNFLKSASGMSAMASLPVFAIPTKKHIKISTLILTDPWLTLDATLNQLLPKSPSGPSASDINATAYLYQVMTVQPTDPEEKDFILKGVGWLNGYANSEKSSAFVNLSFTDKESLLKGISKSRAGRNWLNTLIGYIYQAMLSPESYGGNPNGIGWQWLEHQAGFPLPKEGQRYFELPTRARVSLLSHVEYNKKRNNSTLTPNLGTRKA